MELVIPETNLKTGIVKETKKWENKPYKLTMF